MDNRKILIIQSQYHSEITNELNRACKEKLIKDYQQPELDIVEQKVPGTFELASLAAKAARSNKYRAVVCFACVVKGETPHFDYICQATSQALINISVETEKAYHLWCTYC